MKFSLDRAVKPASLRKLLRDRAPPVKVKFILDSRVPPQPRSFAKKVKYSLFANSEREAAAEPVPLI